MIYLGDTQLNTFPLGDTQPLSAYLGSTLVWPDGTPPSPYAGQYLTFIAQEAGTFKFSGSTTANTLQYSLDSGTTWTTLPHNTNSPTVQPGSSIIWKGSNLTITSARGIGRFSSSGLFYAQGNIMSLLYGDSFTGQTSLAGKDRVNYSLFYNCTGITSAENMILPATTLAQHCYRIMFYGCTSLTTAPELPATTLAEWCYYNMFQDCTSLTTAPELPATTLANYCYQNMFVGCTSLTTAPGLPATTLADYCYNGMFQVCTSLTTAPSLPATTLANYCYRGMFQGCTSLTTVQQTLPATTLAHNCYGGMFQDCTSLTTAPELPATTLVQNCYDSMFYRCSYLNYVKCLATSGINTNNSTSNWLNGVSSSGTFVKASTATWPTGGNGIPTNWTVQSE